MPLRVALYSPDRAIVYDGRTPDETGVGGGITARLSLLGALASAGQEVTAYVNCRERIQHAGVTYVPLDAIHADGAREIDTDVFIAMSTGGDLSFAPLRDLNVRARMKIVWVQGVPKPDDLDAVGADRFVVASRFLRDVLVARWGVPFERVFPCHNGLHQERFVAARSREIARDPYALAYIGPPEKGLASAIEVLRRLRHRDERFHLDVFGGGRLWGREGDDTPVEPGVQSRGMFGQVQLVPELFAHEYCLAPQAMEEGFGIAVQEARRAGQIVIANRVGAFGELIRDGHDGFLVNDHHATAAAQDRMAEIVLALAADPARRARVRRRAIAAASVFCWTQAARTWVEYCEEYIRRANRSPARQNSDSRILIAGYYGHGNLGDEAILGATLSELRARAPSVQVVVASANPAETRAAHHVDAVHERDVPALVEASGRSTAVVLGGGGLFQDYFGLDERTILSRLHWGLTFLTAFPAIAASQKVPFVLFGVGVGPLDTLEGRRYSRLIFERASLATVRDAESLDLVGAIDVRLDNVQVTADPAFLIEPAPVVNPSAVFADAGVPASSAESGVVAVVLRAWDRGVDPDAWQRDVAAALDRLIDARRCHVMFVPFQATPEDRLTDDRAVAERVQALMRHRAAATIAPSDLDAGEVARLFTMCTAVLAMRLHGVILAAVAGTPVVALAYDPKVRVAMRQLGFEDRVIDLNTLSAGELARQLEESQKPEARNGKPEAKSQKPETVEPARLNALRDAARSNVAALVVLLRADAVTIPAASPEWAPMIESALVERGRYAAVMEARAEDLRARVADQEHALGRAADQEHALVRAAEDLRARVADQEHALVRAAEDVETARFEAAATARRLAAREGELAFLSTETEYLRGIVNRRPVRAYLASRRLARQLTRQMFRRAIVSPAKRVVSAGARHLMNGPSYVFDRYKRDRMLTYGQDLGGVHAACEFGLVSIVLPVYNGAAMVGSAIDSVLRQTYSNFELIIIDDGSTDETAAIVDAYAGGGVEHLAGSVASIGAVFRPGLADRRVRVIHQANQRLPAALSRGFRAARGEFLTWTSADNWMKPVCLEKLVTCLRRHPTWDVAYANLDVIDEEGKYWRNSPHYEGYQRPPGSEHVHLPPTTRELNIVANNSIGAAFLYRSRVAMLLGDYSSHRFVMEDYDYWMRANAFMNVRHADFSEPIYDYRFHSQSLTSRWNEFDMLGHRDRLMVFDDFRRDFSLSPMVWVIEGSAPVLASALEGRVRAAGHLVHAGEYALADLPRLSVPVVYARLTRDPSAESPPRADLPTCALKVLITDARSLPDRVSDGWDICCAITGQPPPRLANGGHGWLAAHEMAALFHALDVRARSAHLASMEAVIEGSDPSPATCKASVVICARRWSDRLRCAVDAVASQQTRHAFEIVVVDNSGSDRIRGEAGAAAGAVRFVICPIPGLSAARNAGLAEARGELVCYLDDDAVPEPDWLDWICRAFDEHRETGVVGGHIRLKLPERPPRALRPGWKKYWSEFLTDHTEYAEVGQWAGFPWGANWSARRDLLRAVGGFRSRYGRTGNNYWGGEEMVAASLIQRLGARIAVEPRASVLHDVDPARFTLSHVLHTMVAGYQVYHRAQNDLYVPRQDRVVALLRRLRAKDFDRDVGFGRLRWVDAALRKYAQVGLLMTEIADLGRRARRAVVDQ